MMTFFFPVREQNTFLEEMKPENDLSLFTSIKKGDYSKMHFSVLPVIL